MSRKTPSILLVCTGNICRSPMAEALLRQHVGRPRPTGSIRISSAGTAGLTGHPLDRHAEQALRAAGVPVPPFTARELTAPMIADADLVLTAAREHRAAAASLAPGSSPRLYTLREFGRLCQQVDPARLRGNSPAQRLPQLIEAVGPLRGTGEQREPDEDDVPDPYRSGQQTFAVTLQLIAAALQPVTAVLIQ